MGKIPCAAADVNPQSLPGKAHGTPGCSCKQVECRAVSGAESVNHRQPENSRSRTKSTRRASAISIPLRHYISISEAVAKPQPVAASARMPKQPLTHERGDPPRLGGFDSAAAVIYRFPNAVVARSRVAGLRPNQAEPGSDHSSTPVSGGFDFPLRADSRSASGRAKDATATR